MPANSTLVASFGLLILIAAAALFISGASTTHIVERDVSIGSKSLIHTEAGLFRLCTSSVITEERCYDINRDCEVEIDLGRGETAYFDISDGDCHEFNAARAFSVLACVFSSLAIIAALAHLLLARSSVSVIATVLAILSVITGVVAMGLLLDLIDSDDRGVSVQLLIAGWPVALAGTFIYLMGTRDNGYQSF